VVQWSSALAMQAGLLPTLACAEAFAMTDFGPDLPAFTVPTLVLHGTNDKTVPIGTSARRAVPAIRGCQVREYVDGPHGLLASHKEALSADVLGFLRSGVLPEPVPVEVPPPLYPIEAPPL
jgi:pimeloyl-ACP methyl ester carboxylesterase